jgi:glycosyltransferase involved in cell wall biosynthesis
LLYAPQSTARKPRSLVLYWGTSGAGIRLAHRIGQEIAESHGAESLAMSLHAANAWLDSTRTIADDVATVSGPVGRKAVIQLASSLPGRISALKRQITRFRPDVVIVPMNFAQALPLSGWLHMRKLPFIYVIHDPAPHPGDYAPAMQRMTQALLMRAASNVVSVSSFVGENVRHWLGPQRSENLAVAPLGLHVQRRRTQPRQLGQGPLRLLFLGRLLAYKGLDILATALREFRDRDDWRLTIAGSGKERDFVLQAFAAFPQVDLSRLELILEDDIDPILDRHDILICPYREASQSGVLAEAMSFGLPALVTPVGALPEQIGYGRAGWIARHATAPGLAAALRTMLDGRAEYAARSAEALAMTPDRPGATAWGSLVQPFALEP